MTTAKKIIFLLILTGISLCSQAQERKIKLTFQSGYFKANNEYTNIKAGYNFGGDASYFVTKRFFVTAHFNYGTGKYYETRRTEFPDDGRNPATGNNADLKNINIGLLAGYCYPVTKWLNVSAQAGIAQYIEIAYFPIRIAHPDTFVGYVLGVGAGTWLSASFPVKFAIGFIPWKYIEVGIAGGFYIEPDYAPAIVGLHVGPQLSVVF